MSARKNNGDSSKKKKSEASKFKAKKSRRFTRNRGDAADSEVVILDLKYIACVFILAILCGIAHRYHVATMFENDRHFSHLSPLERELSFRTEMGFYYSYFKSLVSAPSLTQGLTEIMYDNVTEYPKVINSLKRFNLYPEVALGFMFKAFEGLAYNMHWKTKKCFWINRGEGMSKVSSCEGMGEPHYFYIEGVFYLAGVQMATYFLFATYLSGSIWGGLITVLQYFYNHGECTRVQWTPPLRESFAYPLFVIELFFFTFLIRSVRRPSWIHSTLLGFCITGFMLPWQFAQFTLLTQLLAAFGTFMFGFIGPQKMKCLLNGHLIGFIISYLFLFGNEMLLTSFYFSTMLSIYLVVHFDRRIRKLPLRILVMAAQGALLVFLIVALKQGISRFLNVADDAHIGDILKSKFTDFKNFHTMLYTCAAEFDFMENETPWRVLKTLLLPCTLVVIILVLKWVLDYELMVISESRYRRDHKQRNTNTHSDDSDDEDDSNNNYMWFCEDERSKPNAELVYLLLQFAAFTVMAVMIMRLKLFWTPFMCLLCSLMASEKAGQQLRDWLPSRFYDYEHLHTSVLVGLIAAMTFQGFPNVVHQRSIKGEFSNYPMEQMVEWIKASTPQNAVFAGPMPTMATVKLCTQRPIVNHPHYEDADLRERTMKIYSMYSRKPADQVWENYMSLGVDYAILEESWCNRRSKPGCSMPEIWDLQDEKHQHLPPICNEIHKNPGPYFKTAYKNQVYHILKVVNKPVPLLHSSTIKPVP